MKFDNIEQQGNPVREVKKGKPMCSGRVDSSGSSSGTRYGLR